MPLELLALLIGALLVAAINYNQPRALAWIAIGAADFVITYAYAFYPLPWMPHAAVTGLTDALVVALLIRYREHLWEKLVQWCFALSVLGSFAILAGWLPDRTTHAIWLELCNWIALLVMGTTGLLRLADEGLRGDVVGQAPRSRVGMYIHRARETFDRERRTRGALAKAPR